MPNLKTQIQIEEDIFIDSLTPSQRTTFRFLHHELVIHGYNYDTGKTKAVADLKILMTESAMEVR